MCVTGAGQSTLQIPRDICDRPALLASDRSDWPPVVRMRFDPNGVEQQGGGYVVRMRDERYAHPRADRFILPAQLVGVPAGPERENKCSGDGHAKGHRQDQ